MTGQQFYQDATVYDVADDKIGTIQAYDPQGGYLTVQKGFLFHKDLYIPVNSVQRTDDDGSVYLTLHKDDLADERYSMAPTSGAALQDAYVQTTTETQVQTSPPAPVQTGRRQEALSTANDTISVPVFEEELVVGKQQTEQGQVHLHKDVVAEQQTVSVPLQQERVYVDRVTVTDQSGVDVADAFQSRDIEVPVMGEQAVVGKQTHVVEEVRLHKDMVTENQQVTDTVRKEHVTVEEIDTPRTQTGTPKQKKRR